MRLSLVTTTHDRPRCWPLLEYWMRRQTIGWHEWIVADDGGQPAPLTMNQKRLRLPTRSAGIESFQQNWLAALDHVAGDVVVPIEDDDYYHPEYLSAIAAAAAEVDVCGVRGDHYYQVQQQRWVAKPNVDNSSLASTAWWVRCNDLVRSILHKIDTQYLDVFLWSFAYLRKWRIQLICNTAGDGRSLHVGLKGMPGPAGLGDTHDGQRTLPDPHHQVLERWVGIEDCALIRGFVSVHFNRGSAINSF